MEINRENIRNSLENVSGKDVAIGAAAIMTGGVGGLAIAAYHLGKLTQGAMEKAMNKEGSMPVEEGPKQSQPPEILGKAWLPNVNIPGRAELAAILRVLTGRGRESSSSEATPESHATHEVQTETKPAKATASETESVSSSSEEDLELRQNQKDTITKLKGFLKIYPDVDSKIKAEVTPVANQILKDGIGEDPVQTQGVIEKVQELVRESQMEALVKFTEFKGLDAHLQRNLTPDEKQIFDKGSGDDLEQTQNLIEKLPVVIQESQRGVLSDLNKLMENHPHLGKDLTQADKDLLHEAVKGNKSDHVDMQKMNHAQQLIGDLQAQLRDDFQTRKNIMDNRERDKNIIGESGGKALTSPTESFLEGTALDLHYLDILFSFLDSGDKAQLTKYELEILDARGISYPPADVDNLIKKMNDLKSQHAEAAAKSAAEQPVLSGMEKQKIIPKSGGKAYEGPAAQRHGEPAKPSSTLAPPPASRAANRLSIHALTLEMEGINYSSKLTPEEQAIVASKGQGYSPEDVQAVTQKLEGLHPTKNTEATPADLKEGVGTRALPRTQHNPVRGIPPSLKNARSDLEAVVSRLDKQGIDYSSKLTAIQQEIVAKKGEGYTRTEIQPVIEALKKMR